ncbi:Hypothetical predicted protein [Lecanosticta acicola]|uniref:Uncharacterized protein n=1 Tax=Lecanosticta acicola TaxID=111012 RepID=A0AAI8YZ79_9PEZI|nr:Hypothetical predicted protein [Lecanosticta acicola]
MDGADHRQMRDLVNTNEDQVRIVFSDEFQCVVNADFLSRRSFTIGNLLAGAPRPPLTAAAKESNAPLYQLNLTKNQLQGAYHPYTFRVVPLDSHGDPLETATEQRLFRMFGDDSRPHAQGDRDDNIHPDISSAFEAVFDAIYKGCIDQGRIDLGYIDDEPLHRILDAALDIMKAAEYLKCVGIVAQPMEAILLAQGQLLYYSISHMPISWLQLSYRIRSKPIFKEALIHATGQWNSHGVQQGIREGLLPDRVVDILEAKAGFIADGVLQVERRLGSYYPDVITRQQPSGRVSNDRCGRGDYANDIYMWMALNVFNKWCIDLMTSDHTRHSADMGFAFIRAVSEGGNAYLDRTTMLEHFHGRFPMSGKGMAGVEHRLLEIKEFVKEWARPLMRTKTQLNLDEYPVEYFTHVSVVNTDFPWLNHDNHDDDEEFNGLHVNEEVVDAKTRYPVYYGPRGERDDDIYVYEEVDGKDGKYTLRSERPQRGSPVYQSHRGNDNYCNYQGTQMKSEDDEMYE